jgi:hypothetical protein
MRFGDPADFAIEAEVEPDLKPPSAVWGRMCVWCRGVPLGNIEDRHCALYPAYGAFRGLESYLDRLWAPELAGLDDVAAWNFLDGLLYGYHGDVEVRDHRSIEQCHVDWATWRSFNFLTNWGEQFDGYKSFLLCPPGGPVRVLSRRLPAHMGRSVEVSLGAVLAATQGFVRWFEEQELRLRGGAV